MAGGRFPQTHCVAKLRGARGKDFYDEKQILDHSPAGASVLPAGSCADTRCLTDRRRLCPHVQRIRQFAPSGSGLWPVFQLRSGIPGRLAVCTPGCGCGGSFRPAPCLGLADESAEHRRSPAIRSPGRLRGRGHIRSALGPGLLPAQPLQRSGVPCRRHARLDQRSVLLPIDLLLLRRSSHNGRKSPIPPFLLADSGKSSYICTIMPE